MTFRPCTICGKEKEYYLVEYQGENYPVCSVKCEEGLVGGKLPNREELIESEKIRLLERKIKEIRERLGYSCALGNFSRAINVVSKTKNALNSLEQKNREETRKELLKEEYGRVLNFELSLKRLRQELVGEASAMYEKRAKIREEIEELRSKKKDDEVKAEIKNLREKIKQIENDYRTYKSKRLSSIYVSFFGL